MKKSIIFALFFLLLLTACGGQAAEIRLPEEPPVLEEPPRLTVETETGMVWCRYGTASWTYTDENGQGMGFEADAVHPLDEQAVLPVLQPGTGTAALSFDEVGPDELVVRCWALDRRGDMEAPPLEIPVENGTLSLQDGEAIYEVVARWKENDRYGGSAYYAFCTRDWGIALTAEHVTAKSLTLVCTQSGGNPTGELNTGSWYCLQRMGDNGWETVPYSDKLPSDVDVAWTAEAWLIPLEGAAQWDMTLDFLYDKLQPGAYRVIKEVMDFRGTGDYDEGMCYTVFTIPEK